MAISESKEMTVMKRNNNSNGRGEKMEIIQLSIIVRTK